VKTLRDDVDADDGGQDGQGESEYMGEVSLTHSLSLSKYIYIYIYIYICNISLVSVNHPPITQDGQGESEYMGEVSVAAVEGELIGMMDRGERVSDPFTTPCDPLLRPPCDPLCSQKFIHLGSTHLSPPWERARWRARRASWSG